jgi:hypothetical protein
MLGTSIPTKQIQTGGSLSKRRIKMVIIANVSYPTESSKEVGKRLGELPPPPAYVTMKGPYVGGEVGVGIQSIVLYEFDQTKTREAMDYVANRLAKYIGVPGFTYSVKLWFEAKEALKMIGLG